MADNDLLGPDAFAAQLKNKTDDELARDMWLPENNQLHLMAKAEMTRRATLVTLRNSRYMLWSGGNCRHPAPVRIDLDQSLVKQRSIRRTRRASAPRTLPARMEGTVMEMAGYA